MYCSNNSKRLRQDNLLSFMLHELVYIWLSAGQNLGGGGAKDNRPLFFKTIGYCFYCSFYCFSKILGGKSRFGGRPLPPCSRKPVYSWGIIRTSLRICTHSLGIHTHSLRIRTVLKFYNHTLWIRYGYNPFRYSPLSVFLD